MSARSSPIFSGSPAISTEERVGAYDWQALAGELDNYGCAVLPKLLSPEECRTMAALYPDESQFRSHIHMARHGFGKGEYRYFKYPLPDLLDGLRRAFYSHLVGVAKNGTAGWESTNAIRATTRRSSGDATMPARRAQHRFCCSMSRVTSTAFTRICMATSPFQSRLRSFSQSPESTSRVASSC